jgi:hypothetical protein
MIWIFGDFLGEGVGEGPRRRVRGHVGLRLHFDLEVAYELPDGKLKLIQKEGLQVKALLS